MALDDFQHERVNFATVADDGKQQAVGIIQLGPVKTAMGDVGEFFHVRRAKIVPQDSINGLFVR